MNTITVQLNDKQYRSMMELLDYAQEHLSREVERLNLGSAKQKQMLADHEELVQELTSTKSYAWTSSLGEVDLDISAEHVEAIAQSGDNEPACRAAIEEDTYLRAQLERMDMAKARSYLKDAGIEDVDSKDDDLVRVYILWMACHDINDEAGMED